MRKICAVTSSRADYGIMSRLLRMLSEDAEIDFRLLVTGTHLSDKFGLTYSEIKEPIEEKIDIGIDGPPSHALAKAVEKFSDAFLRLRPDILLLLGDRYEIMGVAQAAMLNNIPIAHLYGGDSTEGAIDEAVRHSITKMSHLHFVSCDAYRRRVIQLGESPERVFNFGALGVENAKKVPLLEKKELEKSLGFSFGRRNLLVTFHPATLEGNAGGQFAELLAALDSFENCKIILTCPNSDEGNEEIFKLISDFENRHENVKVYESLGLKRYLSCMRYVDAVVGNSSSGIYEAPSFGIPTVNIGGRQRGRIQAESIINCRPDRKEIVKALQKAYKSDFSGVKNPYEGENTALNIFRTLKSFKLDGIINKKFYDIS